MTRRSIINPINGIRASITSSSTATEKASSSLSSTAPRLVFPSVILIATLLSILSLSFSKALYHLDPTESAIVLGGTTGGFVNSPLSAALSDFHHRSLPLTLTDSAAAGGDSGSDYDSGSTKKNNTPSSESSTNLLSSHSFSIPLEDLYAKEQPIPNPPLSDGYNTFSACMLLMDDNHRLSEWIAYHFHVLPLRQMIIAVDPRSKTSPTVILNQWRQMGVYIEEWTDQDFWKSNVQGKPLKLLPIPDTAELQVKRDRHRGRQKYFYKQCLIQLREKYNRTWVTLHDSDEFIVYNHVGGDAYEAWEKKRQKYHFNSTNGHHRRTQPSQIPPTTAKEGGMIQYIRQEQKAGLRYYQSPCIGIPRLQFAAVESTSQQQGKQLPESISQWIDPEQFDTLRWRWHARRNDFVKNALGKVMIDVSRINIKATPPFLTLHRPITKHCPAPWNHDFQSGLRINHYLGSWESYSIRDDARRGFERSREQWEYKSMNSAEDTDDNIRPWLNGFVNKHGPYEAQRLLKTVGLPKGYQRPHDGRSWTLLPDKLEGILKTNLTIANDNKKVLFDAYVRERYSKNLKRSAT